MNALRSVLLVLAVGVLGLVGWRSAALRRDVADPPPPAASVPRVNTSAVPAVAPTAPAAAPDSAPRVDRPEFAAFYGRLAADLPRDYAAASARVARDGVDAATWDVLRDLEQSRGVLVAQAEPATLDGFFAARSALLDGMAPLEARRCVDFLYGMADGSFAAFTAGHRGLVAALADRTLDAILDGGARHIDRAAPTEADLDALAGGLAARGLSRDEIGLMIDGTTPDPPLRDRRACDVGRLYLDAIRALPPDARGRIYGLAAQLLSRS